ncbi:MAG: dipeptidase, partial [Lysobacterales bacterium]
MPFTRRELLSLAAASTALASLAPRYLTAASPTGFYDDSIIIDGLGFPGGLETEENSPLTALEIEQLRDSGLTALNVTVGAVGTMNPLEAFEKIVRSIARWEGEIAAHSEALTGILSVADIRKAKQAGRTGLIYGLQDGVSFEDDLERLATLHQVGVRIIQPIYNRRNLLGDGCMEPANAGLSRDGVEAIERMNELGILVDLSHSGRRTAMDAIAASKRPVSFTHSGADAVAP